jgi:hypothetical protein
MLINAFPYGLLILFISLIRFEVDCLGNKEAVINFNALKYGQVLVQTSSAPLPLFLLLILWSPWDTYTGYNSVLIKWSEKLNVLCIQESIVHWVINHCSDIYKQIYKHQWTYSSQRK